MLAPHFARTTSNLGASDTVFFHVSTESASQWINGIFHNSPYGIFKLGTEKGKLKVEMISRGLNTPKMRKATVKSEAHAINKILQWMGQVGGESYFVDGF